MTPTTRSGAVLVDVHPFDLGDERFPMLDAILAIEQEAIAAERARLAEAVRGLPESWRSRADDTRGCVDRAAVLALLEPTP